MKRTACLKKTLLQQRPKLYLTTQLEAMLCISYYSYHSKEMQSKSWGDHLCAGGNLKLATASSHTSCLTACKGPQLLITSMGSNLILTHFW